MVNGGRRAATTRAGTARAILAVVVAALGFVLEIAMIAAFLFWGLRLPAPWTLPVGVGLPLLLLVFWGVYLAPRSERRWPAGVVRLVALLLFLLAGGLLLVSGVTLWGVLLLVLAVVHAVAGSVPARR